jgi:hypothetical protein
MAPTDIKISEVLKATLSYSTLRAVFSSRSPSKVRMSQNEHYLCGPGCAEYQCNPHCMLFGKGNLLKFSRAVGRQRLRKSAYCDASVNIKATTTHCHYSTVNVIPRSTAEVASENGQVILTD